MFHKLLQLNKLPTHLKDGYDKKFFQALFTDTRHVLAQALQPTKILIYTLDEQ